jgi:ATP phosphoribosyltransferase
MDRLALPSGRLLPSLLEKLDLDGLIDPETRDYTHHIQGCQIKILHPRTIPKLVALGRFDKAYTGLDLVKDSPYYQDLSVTERTGLNEVDIVVASSEGPTTSPNPDIIATEYTNIAQRWAFDRIDQYIIIPSHGHTEALAPDDADRIIECVETERTLRANGLTIDDVLFTSETVAITGTPEDACHGRSD